MGKSSACGSFIMAMTIIIFKFQASRNFMMHVKILDNIIVHVKNQVSLCFTQLNVYISNTLN